VTNKSKLFLLLPVFVISILFILFVSAYFIATPGAITITQNVSSFYDEGNFSVNWTFVNATAGEDIPKNYSIIIWTNRSGVDAENVFVTDGFFAASNDSGEFGTTANTHIAGYTFNNHTEANYTFMIVALNASPVNWTGLGGAGGVINSTRNISVYVDRTAPTVTLSNYTNTTSKNANTSTLTLNISVVDALSGLTGSACIIDINGTNQTVFASSGWCNTSDGNLTGLADGNATIKVYVNDTVGNLKLNDSFVVLMDSVNPTSSASCSPTTVNTGDAVTCTCSGADGGSGVNATLTTGDSTPSTSSTGTFSYGCSITDNAGNSKSSTTEYTVEQSPSSGSNTGTTNAGWTNTYTVSSGLFEQGYTKALSADSRLKVTVNSAEHHVGIKSLTETQATIEIASDPVEVILAAGEEAKVDVTDDNFYDIYVMLNSIENNKANVTIQQINEAVPEENQDTGVDTTGSLNQTTSGDEPEEAGSSNWWIWVLIIVVLVAAILYFKYKK